MERIFNKQTVLYLILAMAATILISLAFFTWRDAKSLNQTDVSQEITPHLNVGQAIPNEDAPREREPVTSREKPLRRNKNMGH